MWQAAKNSLNKIKMGVSNAIYAPPETEQFEENGQLSPDQFKKAGDKLTEVCSGWKWMPSSNPTFISKYLDQKKQYLVLQKVQCRKRIGNIESGSQQKVQGEDGQQIIVLHPSQVKQEEYKQQNLRYYTMYIVYDEYYHTPRMFFSATDFNGKPVNNEDIKQDIQKQYLDKTLTIQKFPFMDNTMMPTVHPCKHANVLKTMSDAMRENGQVVSSHFALLIFLKFITSVIPTVQFDITGNLIFE